MAIDVADPRSLKPVNFRPAHPRSWPIHCQGFGDLLLVAEEFDFFKHEVKNYCGQSLKGMTRRLARPWRAKYRCLSQSECLC